MRIKRDQIRSRVKSLPITFSQERISAHGGLELFQILDGPAEFPFAEDHLGYYAVYFRGPDGMKFECVHMPGLERIFRERGLRLERRL